MEAAAKDVREMQGTPQPASAGQDLEEVHVVSKRTEFVCYRCGQSGHSPAHCTFRTAQCHKCGKLGHIKKMCQSKKILRGGGVLQIPGIAGKLIHTQQRAVIPDLYY